MVNFGLFHLLDRTKTVGFDTAMTCLLQQPWVVFSCQIQTASDKQVRVSTLQFATAAGDVYIFDCLALGTQAIHEHGLAWLLQSPTVKKIMYSSNNTAAALWCQLKIQVDGGVDLQVLTAVPHQWPALPPSSERSIADAVSECDTQATPLPTTAPLPINKSPMQLSTQSRIYPDSSQHVVRKDVCHVRADASSQISGRRGHESPQAVLDLILDDLESDALSNPDDIVYQFSRDSPSTRRSDSLCPPRQARGRCSSMGSMSLLDSMQLMEVPILPGMQMHSVFPYLSWHVSELPSRPFGIWLGHCTCHHAICMLHDSQPVVLLLSCYTSLRLPAYHMLGMRLTPCCCVQRKMVVLLMSMLTTSWTRVSASIGCNALCHQKLWTMQQLRPRQPCVCINKSQRTAMLLLL